MVMMRDFVQRKARALGLVGWTRNLSNGTVEVLAQGEHSALERFEEKLHKGSLLSRVDSVVVRWGSPEASYTSFEIIA
jgi:acylphosphatase